MNTKQTTGMPTRKPLAAPAVITLDWLKDQVTAHGFTLADNWACAPWEDEFAMYAASVEVVPGCYFHPQFEATYNKRTGWLTVGQHPAIKAQSL